MRPEARTAAVAPSDLALGWLETWRLATSLAWESMALLAHAYDLRPARRRWSAEATRWFDRYLRTPEVLDLMTFNLNALAAMGRFAVR